ncbi:general transcription factor IIIC subunit l(2)37Cd [Oratosquilla oratoria]|uniref:general transcription factor IIIC subunit l(2)37Cd n=1 Tax=Oratosquilla oratoria TaxID=337810 RepID=UPI003F76720F
MTTVSGRLRQYVCIEYPGMVNSVDNMIETLGGIQKISKIYCEDNRRMELRFRPNDVYCKPTCGERHNSTALLIKVVRRRKKKKLTSPNPKAEEEEPKPEESLHTTLMGVVHTTYRFNNMCDFQYVPVSVTEDRAECFYDSLVPHGIVSSAWLNLPAPLFLPPAAFSRMDTPQDYRYRREPNSDNKTRIPENIICRTRQRRTHFAIFLSYRDEGVPKGPQPGAISQIHFKFMDNAFHKRLKEEFEKRPIWSKNALRVRLSYNKDKLKYLLPTVSYYFHTGPWRNLWVRFGYDPRKDPKAWIYQTFDYRIRQAGGAKTKVEAKRSYSNYILPYKSSNASKRKISVIQSLHLSEGLEEAAEGEDQEGLHEELYIFRPGTIPPYRQMFYQYCDLHVPEIQVLLEETILSDAPGVCSEKNGFLPPGVETKCRDIMTRLIRTAIAERTASGKGFEDEEIRSNSESEDSATEDNSTEEDAIE